MNTTHATVTEPDPDIAFTDIVVSTPATGIGFDSRRRRHVASKIALIAGGAVALVGASASLVERVASELGQDTVPAAISPSDASLGYLLSDDFPDISIGPPPDAVPAPPDLILGYLLSDELADIAPGRDRTQDPLALLVSEDVGDRGGQPGRQSW